MYEISVKVGEIGNNFDHYETQIGQLLRNISDVENRKKIFFFAVLIEILLYKSLYLMKYNKELNESVTFKLTKIFMLFFCFYRYADI